MVDLKKDMLKSITEDIQQLRNSEQQDTSSKENISDEDVFVFFSLDLTNSTKFKNEQPQLWPEIISAFYDVVLEQYGVGCYNPINNKIPNNVSVNFWKFVGDEVLLYAKIYNYKDIYDLVQATDDCIDKIPGLIDQQLRKKSSCPLARNEGEWERACKDKECEHYKERLNECARETIICNSLGVKATIWIALCRPNSFDGKNDGRNIIYLTKNISGLDIENREKQDFLGPEIDEGFRLSKYAVKNRVIVSSFLAYILYSLSKNDQDFQMLVRSNFKIVSFQKLKGIWNERVVPVVMYISDFTRLYELAEYDELELPTYGNVKKNGLEEFLTDSRYSVQQLKKIFREVHLIQEAELLEKRLSDLDYKPHDIINSKHVGNELHVACACFVDNQRLLIIQHEERGWEFGCTHVSEAYEWKAAIEEGYEEKYQLKIEVDDNPIPIATYTYNNSNVARNTTALGLIVLAKTTESSINDSKIKGKSKIISQEELKELKKEKTVDKFVENAQIAFNFITRGEK